MAYKTKTVPVREDWGMSEYTFCVTVQRIVGEVNVTPDGTFTPRQAAFDLIAQEGEAGTYGFPMPDGTTCEVTVAYVEHCERQ